MDRGWLLIVFFVTYRKADETDGDMYLVPTSDRPRYERIRPGTAETNLDQHDVTYDTITWTCMALL